MTAASKVVIYTTNACPYCVKAKALFDKKKIPFQEIKIVSDEIKEEMIQRSGGKKTVPQIFINQKHIGGCDDLYDLDRSKELEILLQ